MDSLVLDGTSPVLMLLPIVKPSPSDVFRLWLTNPLYIRTVQYSNELTIPSTPIQPRKAGEAFPQLSSAMIAYCLWARYHLICILRLHGVWLLWSVVIANFELQSPPVGILAAHTATDFHCTCMCATG